MRILYVLTAPQMAVFLRGQVAHLGSCGFKVVICAPEKTPLLESISREEGARIVCVPIRREIAPWWDIVSFLKLGIAIRRESPDVTVTLGPKAGLLGGLASAAAGVRARVQTKWGLRLETARGMLWVVLYLAELVSSALSHRTFFDGESARRKAISMGIVPKDKAVLIGNGSANGIDHLVFSPQAKTERLYKLCGTNESHVHVGFVGRINRDKGLAELIGVWKGVLARAPKAILVIVGTDDSKTPEERDLLAHLRDLPRVHLLGKQSNLQEIFPAFQVFLLPSHREGFGVVVLEAASCGVPTVGFNVTGVRDSVVDGKTGALVPFMDIEAMTEKVIAYIEDAELARAHGMSGRSRVIADFNRGLVWKSYYDNIMSMAAKAGCIDRIPQYNVSNES